VAEVFLLRLLYRCLRNSINVGADGICYYQINKAPELRLVSQKRGLHPRTTKEPTLPRRASSSEELFQATLQKLNALSATPLRAISERLSTDLAEARCSFLSKSIAEDELLSLCAYIRDVVDRLPLTFGERFFFDAEFIRALGRDLARDLPLSGMVIPRYGREWGHQRLMMPWEKNRKRGHAVHLIHVDGKDQLENVGLLDYPWMAHEWGHYIMLRHDGPFSEGFQRKLGEVVTSLRLSAIAHRGLVRAKSQDHIQELIKFWTPSVNHQNWAHELAIDLLSLWTCGPAYLACFGDHLESQRPNPYMVEQSHPPYSVRAEALIEAARLLGLEGYTIRLSEIEASWEDSEWHDKRDNHFIGLNNQRIREACIQSAFDFCESLKLTKCTAAYVESILSSMRKSAAPKLGLELLIMARAIFVGQGEHAYNQWESAVVASLANELTR